MENSLFHNCLERLSGYAHDVDAGRWHSDGLVCSAVYSYAGYAVHFDLGIGVSTEHTDCVPVNEDANAPVRH